MKRRLFTLVIIVLGLISFALPAAAGLTLIDGTLTSSNLLPNGKPSATDCVSAALQNYPPLYYQLRQFQVTASGTYTYRDVGFLDDSDTYGTIDIEISVLTGAPAGFNPAEPRGNGCFAHVDDNGSINLTAGTVYTLVVTTNDDDPNVGYYIFSLNGPGDVVFPTSAECVNPLPTDAVIRAVPAGAPAFYAPDLSTQVNFTLPAGTWYTTGTSGDFTQIWIACAANPIWIPTNAIAP